LCLRFDFVPPLLPGSLSFLGPFPHHVMPVAVLQIVYC
jgi:hypothetical protein